MKVKCIFNTGKALRPYEGKPLKSYEFGKFGASESTHYGLLEIGREYIVMGIFLREGVLGYLIDDGGVISTYPYQLFEVTDNKLPADWYFRAFTREDDRFPYQEAVWGYYELCFEDNHYEQLVEREEQAMRIYYRRKIEFEKALAE